MPTSPVIYASPLYVPKFRGFSAAGIPLAGGSCGVFIAGTTTPFATYQTYADALNSTNPNSHPVPLDANGEANIFVPVTSVLLKAVLKDAGGVTQWTEDFFHPGVGYPGVGGQPFGSQWRPLSDITNASFAYASGTSFVVTGVDVTSTLHVGRRVQTINAGGTITSTVVGSTFGVNTTITLVNDSGVLDAGLSAIYYGIVGYQSSSHLDPRTAFGAARIGNQTSFAGPQKVTGWGVNVDSLGEWVAGSNHWLCKYPGNYHVSAAISFSNTVVNINHILAIANTSGTSYTRNLSLSAPVAGQINSIHSSYTGTFAAGGTVSMYVTGDANTTVYGVAGETRINIIRVP